MNKNIVKEHLCTKEVSCWLVILDNIPTVAMYTMGCLIISHYSSIAAVFYITYCLMSIIWFWARICPYCHYHNTKGCPCGYGLISAKMFERRMDKPFGNVFKMNIIFLFPSWFVPPVIGIILIINKFTYTFLWQLILFCIIGFIIIPFISKLVGCKDCEIKDDCPWMKK